MAALASSCQTRPARVFERAAARPQRIPARPRTRVRVNVLLEDPYRTLGVRCDADEKEIKAAYRRLALKYHPDVNQTHDAERRFVSIQQAYEVLTGKRQQASGVYTRNQHNNWDFQDWFWSFNASRRWASQHHARPAQDQQRAPQERAILNTQLAGLRQRAAIRNTQKAREEAQSAAEPQGGAEADMHDSKSPAGGQQQHHYQQQHHHYQASMEYDSTPMSDGVNMAAGEGYDPWSPEAAAAARRPKFTATESVKSQVVGQLGGLKRKAAVKRRVDAQQQPFDHQQQQHAHAHAHAQAEEDAWSV